MRPTARKALAVALSAAGCLLAASTGFAQSDEEVVDGHRARRGEVIVRYRTAPTADQVLNVTLQADAESNRKITRQDHWRVKSRSQNVPTLMANLASNPDVDYVEPNYIVTAEGVPTDTAFALQWGSYNTGQSVNGGTAGTAGADIDAVSAWDVTKGSRSVVVAVLDSGLDYTHPDLAANVWSAPSAFTVTIGSQTVTCPAGTRGFNTLAFTCDPLDDYGHGTHVAGVIGAVGGNAAGVTGVSQLVTLMPLKILDAAGVGTVGDAIEAIEFAIQAKAAFGAGANVRVLNNSWGGAAFSQALQDVIAKASTNDMLFVASAGNDGSNNDFAPYYPASYPVANVLSVGAFDNTGLAPLYSNFGQTSVHLSAPGVDIYSTAPGSGYSFRSGTSQAAAFVSGGAALILSKCTLATAGLRSNLLGNVTVSGGLTGMNATAGRLNVNTAVRSCSTPPTAPTGLKASSGSLMVTLTWTASPSATSYTIKRGTKATGTFTAVATGVTGTSFTVTGLTNGSTYYFKVAAVNGAGTSPDSAYVIGTPAAIPAVPIGLKTTPGTSQIYLAWSAATGATGYYIKYSLVSGGPYTKVAQTTSRSYYHKGLTAGTTYCYVIAGYNKNLVEGPQYAQVCAISK